MERVRIALAQINTIVGDLKGNTQKVQFCIDSAREKRVDLVIFPELTITGYPPEDLLLRNHFIIENKNCLKDIVKATSGLTAIVGFVDMDKKGIYNAAAIINNKKIVYIYRKRYLPNYGVFDEKRYFLAGDENVIVEAGTFSFGVSICEDIWIPSNPSEKRYFSKIDFLVNVSASPYHFGKMKERRAILSNKAKRYSTPILYCNLIGGQDELLFDGRSAVYGGDGRLKAALKAFEEDFLILDLSKKKIATLRTATQSIGGKEEVYQALVLGVRDYVRKNGFSKVTLGLSGGVDSALVSCIACDALGKANVLALSMPSIFSSEGSQKDAESIAKNLGIRFSKIPIDSMYDSYIASFKEHFSGMDEDITEENIQARIRGNILMAFSNKFGYLVLNTGNKSEMSVGYCTLYGDMAGGFAVIKDVPKRLVYELARYRNKKEGGVLIPESVFSRAPSAELRPDQRDQDTLPPYDLLDKVIDLYIEKDKGFSEIVKVLKDKEVVKKLLDMIDRNEYKRRQAPPGIKITPKSFGKDRRMPITNKFSEAGYGKSYNEK